MNKKQSFNAFFFISIFINVYRPRASWASESEDQDCGNIDSPFVDTDIVRDQQLYFKIRLVKVYI